MYMVCTCTCVFNLVTCCHVGAACGGEVPDVWCYEFSAVECVSSYPAYKSISTYCHKNWRVHWSQYTGRPQSTWVNSVTKMPIDIVFHVILHSFPLSLSSSRVSWGSLLGTTKAATARPSSPLSSMDTSPSQPVFPSSSPLLSCISQSWAASEVRVGLTTPLVWCREQQWQPKGLCHAECWWFCSSVFLLFLHLLILRHQQYEAVPVCTDCEGLWRVLHVSTLPGGHSASPPHCPPPSLAYGSKHRERRTNGGERPGCEHAEHSS